MHNLNSLIIEGNVVRDPVVKATPRGTPLCMFRKKRPYQPFKKNAGGSEYGNTGSQYGDAQKVGYFRGIPTSLKLTLYRLTIIMQDSARCTCSDSHCCMNYTLHRKAAALRRVLINPAK